MIGTNNIILVIIVGFVVIYLFTNLMNNIQTEEKIKEKITEKFDNNDNYIVHQSSGYVPLKEREISDEYLIDRVLHDEPIQRCPEPIQSIKQFNRDFFNFRDKTEINTAIAADPVDKILTMDIKPGMAIKDYYDELVSAKNDLYSDKQTRYRYDASHVTGLHNVRDTWIYQNENILNGGQIASGLLPHSTEHSWYPALETIIE